MVTYRKKFISVLCIISILFFTACGSMYSAPGNNPEVIRRIFDLTGVSYFEYEESSDALVMPGGKKMTAQDGEHISYSGILTLSNEEASWLVDNCEWKELDTSIYRLPEFKYVNATSLTGKKWYSNDILYTYFISPSEWDVMFMGFDGNDTIVFWISEKDH